MKITSTSTDKVEAPAAPDDTQVICPACCHQFRAIPPQVQQLLLDSGHEPPFEAPSDYRRAGLL